MRICGDDLTLLWDESQINTNPIDIRTVGSTRSIFDSTWFIGLALIGANPMNQGFSLFWLRVTVSARSKLSLTWSRLFRLDQPILWPGGVGSWEDFGGKRVLQLFHTAIHKSER